MKKGNEKLTKPFLPFSVTFMLFVTRKAKRSLLRILNRDARLRLRTYPLRSKPKAGTSPPWARFRLWGLIRIHQLAPEHKIRLEPWLQ